MIHSLLGYKVCAHPLLPPTRPKQTLHPDVQVSLGFREGYNSWLHEFFGEEPFVMLTRNPLTREHTLLMAEEVQKQLESQLVFGTDMFSAARTNDAYGRTSVTVDDIHDVIRKFEKHLP